MINKTELLMEMITERLIKSMEEIATTKKTIDCPTIRTPTSILAIANTTGKETMQS